MSTAMPSSQPRNPDWEARVRESFARQPFMTLIGGEIEELKPGVCEVALKARPDLCQQRGFLHGGVTTALGRYRGRLCLLFADAGQFRAAYGGIEDQSDVAGGGRASSSPRRRVLRSGRL